MGIHPNQKSEWGMKEEAYEPSSGKHEGHSIDDYTPDDDSDDCYSKYFLLFTTTHWNCSIWIHGNVYSHFLQFALTLHLIRYFCTGKYAIISFLF